jgi:hypothetical protein
MAAQKRIREAPRGIRRAREPTKVASEDLKWMLEGEVPAHSCGFEKRPDQERSRNAFYKTGDVSLQARILVVVSSLEFGEDVRS